jgi:hypothetical protein
MHKKPITRSGATKRINTGPRGTRDTFRVPSDLNPVNCLILAARPTLLKNQAKYIRRLRLALHNHSACLRQKRKARCDMTMKPGRSEITAPHHNAWLGDEILGGAAFKTLPNVASLIFPSTEPFP